MLIDEVPTLWLVNGYQACLFIQSKGSSSTVKSHACQKEKLWKKERNYGGGARDRRCVEAGCWHAYNHYVESEQKK